MRQFLNEFFANSGLSPVQLGSSLAALILAALFGRSDGGSE